ncbi:MAG: excalibur calcium-binding domain-containing protein [bacterium]|nr:excalibur calcium-binding domain-containing protein [bacterium]MDE0234942.1 excalibur calcium-binding domain-containing protein [bacterium]
MRLLAALAVIVVGASCGDDPAPEIPTTLAPITSTSTTRLATTTLPPPDTTLAETTTTSTTLISLAEESMNYLEVLLAVEVNIGKLVADVQALNENWDNRSESGVSYGETDAGMEAAAQRAQELRDAFEGIQPSSQGNIPLEHQTAAAAVVLMADTAAEMLDGLRSTDTGQSRRSALVGFLTAYEIFGEAVTRVAEIIGDEAIAALESSRTANTVPTIREGTTTTTEAATTTTAAPATDTDPENPGNTKNCSDFATQAEAQEWFDTYFPLYGDVALMDTNNNGIACELLP